MVKYGITTSHADYWCHVTPRDRGIYVYKVCSMRTRMIGCRVKEIPTAIGHLVPCAGIPFFKCGFVVPKRVDTGEQAEEILANAVKVGCLWWRPQACVMATVAGQFQGMDMKLVQDGATLECKLDGPGGINGTGNLFVQTHERRP